MNADTLAATLFLVCAMLAAGLICGLAYFRALRRTADLLAGRDGWFVPAALTVARIGGAIVVLSVIARLGALALLTTLAGFSMARMSALRSSRRAL
jgi:F1-F0 ATPase (N-ATPase) AtpR subunit